MWPQAPSAEVLRQPDSCVYARAILERHFLPVDNLTMANESPTLVQSPGFVPEPTSATFSPADSSFSFPNEPPTSVPNANRRRKSSTKGTPSAVIKRSMSSPNVRGLSSAVELPGSLAEKRRNKLGYHRTSVACGSYGQQSCRAPSS